jgi:O-methyltransferase
MPDKTPNVNVDARHAARSHSVNPEKARIGALNAYAARALSVPGHILEIGCHKCGTLGHLSGIFPDRELIGFDRFEAGFSELAPEDDNGVFFVGMLGSSLDDSAAYLAACGITNVRLVRGDVRDTLKAEPPYAIAMAVIDLDLYAPTLAALRWAWDRLSPGGSLLVDDIGFPGVDRAMAECGIPWKPDGFWGTLTKPA